MLADSRLRVRDLQHAMPASPERTDDLQQQLTAGEVGDHLI
jgi:hypothetical protein